METCGIDVVETRTTMRNKVIAVVAGLAMAALAITASADIGNIIWKAHCPTGASVITHEAADGVDVVCIQFVDAAR